VEVNSVPQHLLLNLHRFTRTQKLMINTTPKLIELIAKGASLATLECRRQFQYRKWNCPISNTGSVFGKILKKGKLQKQCFMLHVIITVDTFINEDQF